MLLAILHRHGGIAIYDKDVFVNIVGGVSLKETGADLAVLLAAYSSFRDQALDRNLIVFGEVGLTGEIRPGIQWHRSFKRSQRAWIQKSDHTHCQ